MKSKKHGVIAGLLSLGAATLLGGCSTILLLNPKGPIGDSQRFVIIAAIVLMAIVVIPVFIMNVWFPLKFRASNTKSTYMPKWSYSTPIDITMWAVPIAIVTLLGILAWTRTYSLDPYKPIPSPNQPITIEAVALDWKWLFIYPEHNIAAVNHITFPVNVPVSFKITSDTVMTSFFIPQLGSQIYAMAGMQTRLHLMADQTGRVCRPQPAIERPRLPQHVFHCRGGFPGGISGLGAQGQASSGKARSGALCGTGLAERRPLPRHLFLCG